MTATPPLFHASVQQENMQLREVLTVADRREQAQDSLLADLRLALDEQTEATREAEATLDTLQGSSTWRMADRLVWAMQHVPLGIRIAIARLQRRLWPPPVLPPPPSEPAPEPEPVPPPPEPAALPIPDRAKFFGMFTQDMAELAATPWYDARTPRVSIVILNWNRSEMTLACMRYVLRHTHGHRFEIIVSDNGSRPEELAAMDGSGLPGTVLKLGTNLYFGEANNVAVERARGEYIVFLNSDAFVHDGWLEPLVEMIERTPGAGAIGSRLLYPDGSVQEAGALISWDGISNQLGKHSSLGDVRYNSPRKVEYVSAASLLMRRQDFIDVLGFELCYEPAYYEDADLCMKLQARGQSVYYCPTSMVTHVEHGASLDTQHDLQLGNIIAANQATFVSRWGGFLLGQQPVRAMPMALPLPAPRGGPRVALCTSAMLMPGGSERYLLGIGQALAGMADVTLVTTAPCSRMRLLQIALDLRLDLAALRTVTLEQARTEPPFDLAVVMGDGAVPGLARRECRVAPFPIREQDEAAWRRRWDATDGIVVYSEAARMSLGHWRARMDLPERAVHTIVPPVHRITRTAAKKRMILSVGRFLHGPHCKRQDLMIDAFRTLVADGMECELHLAGALRPEAPHRAYYLSVVAAAKGLPVVIHPNIDAVGLERLYAESAVYWHLTGFGTEPETPEYAGIAILEAMSAACVPVAYDDGGPGGIIATGQDGYLVGDLAELVDRTRSLLDDPDRLRRMGDRGVAKAAGYDDAVFARAVQDLAGALLPS